MAAARLTITGRLKSTHNSQLLPGNKSPCYSTKLQILGRQTILMDRPAGSGTIFAPSSSNPPSAPNAVSHLLMASDVGQFAGMRVWQSSSRAR
jgi:hypothetical protein